MIMREDVRRLLPEKGFIDSKDALIQGTVANRDTASMTM